MSTLNDSVSKTRRIFCVIVFALAYAAPNFAQYQFSPLWLHQRHDGGPIRL